MTNPQGSSKFKPPVTVKQTRESRLFAPPCRQTRMVGLRSQYIHISHKPSNTSTKACTHTDMPPAHIHTYIHTYVHTCRHTYIHTYVRTYIQRCVHTDTREHIHVHVLENLYTYSTRYISPLTCMSRFLCLYACTCTSAFVESTHIYVHIHTYIPAYIHRKRRLLSLSMYMCIYIYTHIHTNICVIAYTYICYTF